MQIDSHHLDILLKKRQPAGDFLAHPWPLRIAKHEDFHAHLGGMDVPAATGGPASKL